MRRFFDILVSVAAVLVIQSCAVVPAPTPDSSDISSKVRRDVLNAQTVVVVSNQKSLDRWMRSGFMSQELSSASDGGSATPITDDGYFLTADHVLVEQADAKRNQSDEPTNVFVVYPHPGGLVLKKARIVWRSKSADLALLHIESATPRHFNWVPADRWIPEGTKIMHGGIATAEQSAPGEIATDVRPENAFTGHRLFKMDIPLQPGDSGGPVVDANGLLVGINSAVEFLVPMETAFFVDSEGCRPSLRILMKIIDSDRARNKSS